jgi:ribosomal protein S1
MIPTTLVEEIRGADALVREFEGAMVAFLHSIENDCCEVKKYVQALALAGEAEFMLEQLRAASSLIAPKSREGDFIAGIEKVYAEADAMLEAIELLLEVDGPPFSLPQLEQEIVGIGEEVRAKVRALGRSGFGLEPPPYRDEDIEELYIAVGMRDLLGWAYYFTARRSIGGRIRMIQPKSILQATQEADLFLERLLARLVVHGVRLPERPSPQDFFWCRGTYAAQPFTVASEQTSITRGDKNDLKKHPPETPIEIRATGVFREIQRDPLRAPTADHDFQQSSSDQREGSGSISRREQRKVLPFTFTSRLGETVSNPHYQHDLNKLDEIWDFSKVISPETIFIVTGCNVAVELLDRPVAERLRDEIDNRGNPLTCRRAIIIGDLWWWKDTQNQSHPVISIGSHNSNSLTPELASKGSKWEVSGGLCGCFVDDALPKVALWGESAGQTRDSVEHFINHSEGLSSFLKLCWKPLSTETEDPVSPRSNESESETSSDFSVLLENYEKESAASRQEGEIIRGNEPESEEGGDFSAMLENYERETALYKQEGDIIRGIVVGISEHNVLIDIGYKSEGIVPREEFLDIQRKLTVKRGDEVDVLLKSLENQDGYAVLSRRDAVRQQAWDLLRQARQIQEPVMGYVNRRSKGGWEIDIEGLQAFLPDSEVDALIDRNLEVDIGQDIAVCVIKLNKKRGEIIVSRKVLPESEEGGDFSAMLENYERETALYKQEGDIIRGIVVGISEHNVLIDIGYKSEGIVPREEFLDIQRKLTVKRGDEVDVLLKSLENQDGYAVLSRRDAVRQQAWEKFRLNSLVQGTVVRLDKSGAFIELETDIEGFIPADELTWFQTNPSPTALLSIGQEIHAVVVDIDIDYQVLNLSIKDLEDFTDFTTCRCWACTLFD